MAPEQEMEVFAPELRLCAEGSWERKQPRRWTQPHPTRDAGAQAWLWSGRMGKQIAKFDILEKRTQSRVFTLDPINVQQYGV